MCVLLSVSVHLPAKWGAHTARARLAAWEAESSVTLIGPCHANTPTHRLKALYFHLSSGNRARSNAALALLAALAARGGSVLSELLAAFDFSHAALPKLARPPKHDQQQQQPGGAAPDGSSADGEQQQPLHWQAWNSPQMGRRPSRALFVEWGE
jgi:hypothetical protein